jgi:hypothetical protein
MELKVCTPSFIISQLVTFSNQVSALFVISRLRAAFATLTDNGNSNLALTLIISNIK